jgi:hypothetical protein
MIYITLINVWCLDTVDFAMWSDISNHHTEVFLSCIILSETEGVKMQQLNFVENIDYVTNVIMYTKNNLTEYLCFLLFELPLSSWLNMNLKGREGI